MSLVVSDTIIVGAYFAVAIGGGAAFFKFTKDKTRRISNLRTYIQVMAVIAIFMGLLIGPFNQPLWQPLGISPRDRLFGTEFFGNQFPDG